MRQDVSMASHIALLRGINVGGRNKVAMADLRDVVAGLGHSGVATYIQSGNVLFTSDETDTAALGKALEEAIASKLGVQPSVIVLSREELARAVRDNPYAGEPNPKLVHAVFFRGPVPQPAVVPPRWLPRGPAGPGRGRRPRGPAWGSARRRRGCLGPRGPVPRGTARSPTAAHPACSRWPPPGPCPAPRYPSHRW